MKQTLSSFGDGLQVAIIGASGGIGRGFIDHLSSNAKVETIYAFSRSDVSFDSNKVISLNLDLTDEQNIEKAAQSVGGKLDLIIVASGILHEDDLQPEKAMRDLNMQNFEQVFAVNAFGPALVTKYFLPLIHKDQRSIFAAVTGRVGSIDDNLMGGWYTYRASKAALHMMVKNAAIETARRYKRACVVSLHPGTVDTDLSKPFSSNVKEGKLFTAEQSSGYMLDVIDGLTPQHSGKLFAFDGSVIPF